MASERSTDSSVTDPREPQLGGVTGSQTCECTRSRGKTTTKGEGCSASIPRPKSRSRSRRRTGSGRNGRVVAVAPGPADAAMFRRRGRNVRDILSSAWVMTCAFAPSYDYIASAGLNNTARGDTGGQFRLEKRSGTVGGVLLGTRRCSVGRRRQCSRHRHCIDEESTPSPPDMSKCAEWRKTSCFI